MPVYPISFSIPPEKIIDYVPTKTRITASIIPGDLSTYIYKTEESYYQGYRDSFFGVTMQKAGWDCMRHYEIVFIVHHHLFHCLTASIIYNTY